MTTAQEGVLRALRGDLITGHFEPGEQLVQESLAERLGVTKAALYRYVPSKQDLLYACHVEAMEIARESMDKGEAEGKGGGAETRHRDSRDGDAARRRRRKWRGEAELTGTC